MSLFIVTRCRLLLLLVILIADTVSPVQIISEIKAANRSDMSLLSLLSHPESLQEEVSASTTHKYSETERNFYVIPTPASVTTPMNII